MAKSLQRLWGHGGSLRSTFAPMARPFSADALVELKPGEIGMVSGIPEEHLRRRHLAWFPRLRDGDLRSYRNHSKVDDFVLARAIAGKERSLCSAIKNRSPPNRRDNIGKAGRCGRCKLSIS